MMSLCIESEGRQQQVAYSSRSLQSIPRFATALFLPQAPVLPIAPAAQHIVQLCIPAICMQPAVARMCYVTPLPRSDTMCHWLARRAAALKFYLYSQLEYVTASMLTKYVPKGVLCSMLNTCAQPGPVGMQQLTDVPLNCETKPAWP